PYLGWHGSDRCFYSPIPVSAPYLSLYINRFLACYIMIFSIGITTIPCAPAAFSLFIFSQKSSSEITVCTATQPSSANGTTVGLFTPCKSSVICDRFFFSTFNTTYFVSFARNTDWILCKSSQIIGFSSKPSLPINIASEFLTSTNGFNPLLFKVPPVDTISQIASLSPSPGAISTDPEIIWISALILYSSKNCCKILG